MKPTAPLWLLQLAITSIGSAAHPNGGFLAGSGSSDGQISATAQRRSRFTESCEYTLEGTFRELDETYTEVLHLLCRQANGEARLSYIDLNHCLANVGGELKGGKK